VITGGAPRINLLINLRVNLRAGAAARRRAEARVRRCDARLHHCAAQLVYTYYGSTYYTTSVHHCAAQLVYDGAAPVIPEGTGRAYPPRSAT